MGYNDERAGHIRCVDGASQRPSSARRIEKLQALVAELAVRDMGCGAVAMFLGCSASAARNYLHELQDAGVITAARVRQPAGCIDKMAYRMHPDLLLAQHFLATLEASQRCGKMATRGGAHPLEVRAYHHHVHIVRDDAGMSLMASSAPARRDPLVAALFGATS